MEAYAICAGVYLLLMLWAAIMLLQAVNFNEWRIRHLLLVIFPYAFMLLILGTLVWDVASWLGTRFFAIVKRGW